MIKISDSLRELIRENLFLQFGLTNRLINLSQLARYLKPLVQARTKKEVEETAITMNLSRIQQSLSKPKNFNAKHRPKIENIIIHSSLAILTYNRSKEIHTGVNKLYSQIQKEHDYISISEGINEITLCIKEKHRETAARLIVTKPSVSYKNIGALGIKFDTNYQHSPGLFYSIFEQLYFQGINIIEIASTASELIIYLAEKDIELAFDTLYQMMKR